MTSPLITRAAAEAMARHVERDMDDLYLFVMQEPDGDPDDGPNGEMVDTREVWLNFPDADGGRDAVLLFRAETPEMARAFVAMPSLIQTVVSLYAERDAACVETERLRREVASLRVPGAVSVLRSEHMAPNEMTLMCGRDAFDSIKGAFVPKEPTP